MNGLNHINYLSPIAIGGGSFVYEDGEFQYLLTSEGRVVINPNGTHEYQYFLKDHLGNTRVTFGEDGIVQEDSYYPFGMLERSGNPAIAGTMAGLSDATGMDLPNKYLYNAEKPEISDFIVFRASSKNHNKQSFFIFHDGKELQDDYGLDWYDYGARFYDPVIGRFTSLDPLADGFEMVSPNNYAFNNPVRWIDLDGLEGVNSGISDPAIGYLYAKAQMGSLSAKDFQLTQQISESESNGTLLGVKYVGIAVSTVFTSGLILAPTALGLNLAKDVLPNNEKAKNAPSNAGGVVGMIGDEFIEKKTGKESDILQEAGELILNASTTSNPIDIINTTIDGLESTEKILQDNNSTEADTQMETLKNCEINRQTNEDADKND